jgi:hypothetical protein
MEVRGQNKEEEKISYTNTRFLFITKKKQKLIERNSDTNKPE